MRTVKCFVYGEEADMRRAVAQRVQRECVWSYCRLLHQAGLSVQCTSLLFSLCLFTHPASKYTPLEKPLEKIPPSSTQCAKNTLPRPPLQPPAFCACLSFGPLPPPPPSTAAVPLAHCRLFTQHQFINLPNFLVCCDFFLPLSPVLSTSPYFSVWPPF